MVFAQPSRSWPRRSTRVGLLSLITVTGGLLAGCASEVPATGSSEDALSATRIRVIPQDDESRVACRAAASTVYCREADARAAMDACSPNGKSGVVALETNAGACAASAPTYPSIESCNTPLDYDCSFYSACLERAIPCGVQGYALGFGEKYCTAFRASSLSPTGKKWSRRVMKCLQEELVTEIAAAGGFASTPAPADRCQEVFSHAFDSHPGCYTEETNSICSLPPGDLASVMHTIGLKEMLTRRTGGQMLSTVGICIAQLTRRLFGGSSGSSSGVAPRGTSFDLSVAQGPAAAELSRADMEASLAEWKRLEAEVNLQP